MIDVVAFPASAVKSGIDTPLYRHIGSGSTEDYWLSATTTTGTVYGYHQDRAADGMARGVVSGEWELYITEHVGA